MANSSQGDQKRTLYRIPSEAKISGVCAGVAEYLGLETWVVRLATITAICFGFPFIIILYLVLRFILDPKPSESQQDGQAKQASEDISEMLSKFKDSVIAKTKNACKREKQYRPPVKEVWRAGAGVKGQLKQLSDTFADIEKRVQNMESCVTSHQYNLNKEFNNI